jgi:DNA-binding transcriptional ArsR family regulator
MATKTTTEPRRRQGEHKRQKAMSHPLRAEILRLLIEEGPSSPSIMARLLGEEIANVTYHAKRLVKLDCAELVEERPVRGAIEHFYRATDRHLIFTEEWEELKPLVKEDLICEFMQKQLDDFVASRRAGIVGADDRFVVTRTPMVLDEAGFKEALEAHERHFRDLFEIEKRSAERRAQTGDAGLRVSSSQACFEMPAGGRSG